MIPEIESSSIEDIKKFQEQKLAELLQYLSKNSKYYRSVFEENNIDIKSIRTLEDLRKIPLTTKDDLQKRGQDFICVNSREIVDYNTTSGTMGDPVTIVATKNDLQRLAYNEHISLSCSNATPDDIFQLIVTLNRKFIAGIAYYLGLQRMGAGIVRVGPGNPQLQFDTINMIRPTAFITVPSFLIKLIEYAEANNIDLKSTSIQKAICIGEPIRYNDFSLNTLGRRITDKWDIRLYSTYASTEMATAFNECEYAKGGHHHPELIIVEFLDDQDEPVPGGEVGEIVITTLGIEGMPLLRFKTGDICIHWTEPCECGRTSMRLGPIIGRKKQMIKYKGTTLYPSALYDILDGVDFVENYFIEVSTDSLGNDDILLKAGCKSLDKNQENLLKDYFRARIRVAPRIVIMDPNQVRDLQMSGMRRKLCKFADFRTP